MPGVCMDAMIATIRNITMSALDCMDAIKSVALAALSFVVNPLLTTYAIVEGGQRGQGTNEGGRAINSEATV